MSARRRNVIALCFIVSFVSFSLATFLTVRRFVSFRIDTQLLGTVQADTVKQTLPIQLVIPDLRIDLPIIPARLENQTWQLTNQGVSLLQSPLTNSTGLIIYGHNWKSLLGNLHEVKLGQTVSLQYSDGNIHNYRVETIMTVSPTRLDVLDFAEQDTVLIYTCTGFLDSQRLVVIARR